ncbi:SubName: Full=Uncharacterized protein {ECO:0000313/EMBL:CCA75454.1} [Serendipita indica DSM 11827]|nr:SubName: Full=Uncharacterized protein {ECO:0000313/EMBL:CCA75454.1} [Serendipita indica DSM 11827]
MEGIKTLVSRVTLVQLGAAAAAVVSAEPIRQVLRDYRCWGTRTTFRWRIGLSSSMNGENSMASDIVYVQLPGVSFYIINSLDVAQELLNKRAKFNSDRRIGYMIMQLMGWNWSPAFINADIVHGTERTMFRRGIGPTKMPLKDPLIERNAQQFVLDLQQLKGNPKETVTNIMGMTIIELAYGHGIVKDHGAEMIALNLEAIKLLDEALLTVWAVDLIPLRESKLFMVLLIEPPSKVRFWPSWMPGGQFKRHGAYSKRLVDCIREWPFQMAVERHKAGTLDHCLADDLINEFGTPFEVQDTLANLYFAGVDTTSTVIIRFLHAMFLFPEIAKKIQAEIDSVIGRDRLPRVTDRADLPYTNAVWKESLRFNSAVPLAIPHSNRHDETINGYFIPKGSLINPNFGFMLSDPRIWGTQKSLDRSVSYHPRPASCRTLPSPSLDSDQESARECIFADRAGFHMTATTIALFNIDPLPGESVPLYTEVQYTKNVLRLPVKFDCMFTPRDGQAVHLLSSIALNQ